MNPSSIKRSNPTRDQKEIVGELEVENSQTEPLQSRSSEEQEKGTEIVNTSYMGSKPIMKRFISFDLFC